MSVLVVDASVGAKWFFEEEYSDFATALLDARYQLHVPEFFGLELDSIICKHIRRRDLTPGEGQQIRDTLRVFPIQCCSVDLLDDTAFEIAVQTFTSPYDCLYVALAILLDGHVVTADRRFYDALQNSSFEGRLCWIADSV